MTKTLVRTVVLAVAALALGLTGCAAPVDVRAGEQARFDAVRHDEFLDLITADSLTLHWFLRDPAGLGIDAPETRLLTVDAPADEDVARVRARIAEFATIDRALLTPDQQDDYDVLAYRMALFEPALEYHYHGSGLLGAEKLHVMTPLMLSEYRFDDREAIDRYLVLLAQVGDVFDSLIRLQDDRAARGLYLTDAQLALVIDECHGFVSGDNVLLASFAERLAGTDLPEPARQAYLALNAALYADVVVPAYGRLVAALERLRDSGATTAEVVVSEATRAAYAHDLARLGISRPAAEVLAIADRQVPALVDAITALIEAAGEDPRAAYRFDGPTTAPDLFDYWAGHAAADFPALPQDIAVEVGPIPDSLKAFSIAYYLVPRLDDQDTHQIRYDADYAEQFPGHFAQTMAHEGIPGHLLQKTWLRSGPWSSYRQVVPVDAYVEGWAQYAETYAYRYLADDDTVTRLHQLDATLNQMVLLRLDLGLHYEGWSHQAAVDYVAAAVPVWGDTAAFAGDFVDYIAVSPLQVVPYAMGQYEIEALRDRYQAQRGASYTDRQFHEDLLNLGPAPFSLLERWMDRALPER